MFLLAGRDDAELARCAADLRMRRDCTVVTRRFDALDSSSHSAWVDEWCEALGGAPHGVVVCHGYLPPGGSATLDAAEARQVLNVNLTSVVSILTPLADRMAAAQRGWIVGVSSVAGDRGRQSNYVYGAAKAGLSIYLQGLRNRLAAHGVHVLTVKAGFVDTPMLRNTVEELPALTVSPDRVARDVRRALRRGRNVIYSPWYWRVVMMVIKWIPERIFKHMRL